VNAPDEKRQWFLRFPVDIVRNPELMNNASATDWKVFLAVALHQGYKTRRCKVGITRISKVAVCSRRAAIYSLGKWVSVGALVRSKDKDGRCNVYEIPEHFTPPPEIGDRGRHLSQKKQKRDPRGKFMSVDCTSQVQKRCREQVQPATDHIREVLNEKTLNENLTPASPQGRSGRAPEAVARPSLTLSEGVIREYLKIKSREEVIAMLRQGNHPVPEFLLGGEA